MRARVCVGTSGLSVWFSDDLGDNWARPYSESGLYLEARCWALSSHARRKTAMLAGTDFGLFKGDLRSRKWTHLPSPMDSQQIWSVAQSPSSPDIILAGTLPAGIYRSEDGGASWKKSRARFAKDCVYVRWPRVTQILFDPIDKDTLWCGVEIDGVHRSIDGGRTWKKLPGTGLRSEDIHGLCITANGGRRIYAATNAGLHISDDDGETWTFQELDSPWQYTRQIVARADGEDCLFLTNGNGPPGDTGRLLRSLDRGQSWTDVGLPGTLNSTPWSIAVNKADPDLIFCGTNLGQMFRSVDGGRNWKRLPHEFGELRTIAWNPS